MKRLLIAGCGDVPGRTATLRRKHRRVIAALGMPESLP
jgi:hypothetical protein